MATVKTTVLLREDLHERLLQEYGKKHVSEAINTLLLDKFQKEQKSLFGVDKDKGMKPFLRDHRERSL